MDQPPATPLEAVLARDLAEAENRYRALARAAETALQDERTRAQLYLDISGAVIVVLDGDNRMTLVNRAGVELIGQEEPALLGLNFVETVLPESDRERIAAAIAMARNTGGDSALVETGALTKTGEMLTLAWHFTAIHDEHGRALATVCSGVDLTDRRRAEQQVAHLAYHDPLTDLPNRALLEEHLELALARSKRQGTAVALLYLDLDGFKLVNDSLGHAAGDELLKDVTARLAERRRDSDLLARQGGDEFLLLLTDLDRLGAEQTASRVADGLLRSLASPFVVHGAEFHIGASVGIALYPKDATAAEELMRHADAAMYQAKADGRNTVCVFREDPHEPLERLSMTSRLRKAITRGEFVLYWQPIVDPRDGTLEKLEVLIRWQDPLRGLVLPGEFIEFAEETGFVDRIGDWVVSAACDQISHWQSEGLVVPPVTINISPRQLRRPDFGDRMRRAIGASGLASHLTVEITESVAMANADRTEAVLTDLASIGIGIAVDDFGLGYSSLARLRELPVQLLKIDRSFLVGVPEDPQAAAIVRAIIELAAALGLAAVAEGVENDAQRQFLVEHDCPLAQGFLLGRPMPPAEIRAILSSARGEPDALFAS